MKNKFMKGMFLFLFLFLIGITSVNANTIDFSKKGSINLSLIDSDSAGIPNVEITIYKLADATLEDANLAYKNIEQLNSCGLDLSTISSMTITKEFTNCIQNNYTFKETKSSDSEGKITFNNLDLALYLIVQTQKTPGYSTIDPFMVLLPQIEENKWIYDINSMPKSDIYKVIDINVRKVWNNEGNRNPQSVTIELLNNGEVIDTVVLNDRNEWNHTWYDMELDDQYSVREKNVPKDYIASYRQEGYNFIVTNTIKLPQTGLQLWLVECLSICGIVSLIIGVALKKKYENN